MKLTGLTPFLNPYIKLIFYYRVKNPVKAVKLSKTSNSGTKSVTSIGEPNTTFLTNMIKETLFFISFCIARVEFGQASTFQAMKPSSRGYEWNLNSSRGNGGEE